ncbi:MAG: hypothetical protein ACJAZO_003075 [Myxococcota bacterium]
MVVGFLGSRAGIPGIPGASITAWMPMFRGFGSEHLSVYAIEGRENTPKPPF